MDNHAAVRKVLIITLLLNLFVMGLKASVGIVTGSWLDVILAFPVALMVFFSGWTVIKENLPWLVDEMAVAPEIIYDIALKVPGVINCHDIASRGVIGRQVFIEMHLIVEAKDVETAHCITEEVESRLEDVCKVLFHTQPGDYNMPSGHAALTRLYRQNPSARVKNQLVHEGGLSLCSSGFNRQILLKHPLSGT